jgi:hypothetical protein
MMTQTELEARLLAVETTLKALEHRLAALQPPRNWLDEVIGVFKDESAFDEVSALGRACRDAEPYPDDPGASDGTCVCHAARTARTAYADGPGVVHREPA